MPLLQRRDPWLLELALRCGRLIRSGSGQRHPCSPLRPQREICNWLTVPTVTTAVSSLIPRLTNRQATQSAPSGLFRELHWIPVCNLPPSASDRAFTPVAPQGTSTHKAQTGTSPELAHNYVIRFNSGQRGSVRAGVEVSNCPRSQCLHLPCWPNAYVNTGRDSDIIHGFHGWHGIARQRPPARWTVPRDWADAARAIGVHPPCLLFAGWNFSSSRPRARSHHASALAPPARPSPQGWRSGGNTVIASRS